METEVTIKDWQLDLCEGHHCATALLNFLMNKCKKENPKAFTEEELTTEILHLFGMTKLREAIIFLILVILSTFKEIQLKNMLLIKQDTSM